MSKSPHLLLACLVALLGALSTGAAEKFVAGTHYQTLDIPVKTLDPDRIEVVEVFSHACIHCYNFDPYVESWHTEQDGDVVFDRLPAIFSDDWEAIAQAYYAAQTLGVLEQMHKPLFTALHDERKDIRKAEVLQLLFEEQADVSAEDFGVAYNSFSVRSRVAQAKAKTRAYKVTGVPTMVVEGKYLIDGRSAGGNVAMLQVVDFLVDKERDARRSAAESAAEE
ncbi:MAG: thiol:disulfide interchange protein DsbA/DsbL [Pseudomonadota bacterium]